MAACVLIFLALLQQAITLEDVDRVRTRALREAHDLRITLRIDGSFHSLAELVLVGHEKKWEGWWQRAEEDHSGRILGSAISFDGEYVYRLQQNGMGIRAIEVPGRFSQYTYALPTGMYLKNVAMAGPRTRGGSNAWESVMELQGLRVDADASGRVLLVKSATSIRTLEPEAGFMPSFSRVGSSTIQFLDYDRYGPLHLPRRMIITNPKEVITITASNIHVNTGVKKEQMRVAFPLGTSVMYGLESPAEIYGVEDLSTAAEACRNWLLYFNWLGRIAPNIKADTQRPALAGVAGRPAPAKRGKLGKRAANTPTGKYVGTKPSAAFCAYIVSVMYAREAELEPMMKRFLAVPDAEADDGALVLLREHVRRCKLHGELVNDASLEQLERWPHPVIIELKNSIWLNPFPRYAIVTGYNEHGFTLVDPNPFGNLAPYPRSRIEKEWSGRAVFTSPVKIEKAGSAARPVGAAMAGLALVVLLGAAFCGRRRFAVGGLVLATCALVGCERSGEVDGEVAVATVSAEAERVLQTREWALGRVYPGLHERSFLLVNDTDEALVVDNVKTSCGCMMFDLPIGKSLAANAHEEFALKLSLSDERRGRVEHRAMFTYSDGCEEALFVRGEVLFGAYADPDQLRVALVEPGETRVGEVRILGDDEQAFSIVSAECDLGERVVVDQAERIVGVELIHDNARQRRRGTLTVRTDHPRANVIRVPVVARYDLSWDTSPSIVFVRGGDEAVIEREIVVESLRGELFVVRATGAEGVTVRPESDEPATEQRVLVALTRPEIVMSPHREEVVLETTIGGAARVVVPFVFYE